ncbi:hypothetical protein [Sphingomonas sp. Sphisp66]
MSTATCQPAIGGQSPSSSTAPAASLAPRRASPAATRPSPVQ